MHINGLFGKRPKEKIPFLSRQLLGKLLIILLTEILRPIGHFKKWSTDVSQFTFPWGKCFFSPILDMSTNEIISYDLSLSPNLEQIQGC